MANKKTETEEKKPTPVDYKEGLDGCVELCNALVREVDNIMSSNMPVQATGKVLGEVMSGFSTQVTELSEKYST